MMIRGKWQERDPKSRWGSGQVGFRRKSNLEFILSQEGPFEGLHSLALNYYLAAVGHDLWGKEMLIVKATQKLFFTQIIAHWNLLKLGKMLKC